MPMVVLFFLLATASVFSAVLRFIVLARRVGRQGRPERKRSGPCRTLIVLGSGGHTSEMMRILSGLRLQNYSPRLYIAADTDELSQNKAKTMEEGRQKKEDHNTSKLPNFSIKTIPRARKVLQSYFTSIFSTLIATGCSLRLFLSFSPDLVLCNGPGTCIPLCLWAYVLNFFGLKATTVVYVESLCRVQRLSLSGLLVYYFYIADHVLVQWPQLKRFYPRTTYIGRVV